MRRNVQLACVLLVCLLIFPTASYAARVMGQISQVANDTVTAVFPVPVRERSMMMLLAGEGESIAGLAMSQSCAGERPPYVVTGHVYLTMDAVHIAAGKKVYVNSLNTSAAPSSANPGATGFAAGGPANPNNDLRLYYFAGGQTAGYGALGLGYERRIGLARSIAIELDGGITGIGSVSDGNADIVSADQFIKNLNGRLKFDFGPRFGAYSGYRWNQGRAESKKWGDISDDLIGRNFVAPSSLDSGTVQTQGLEYGISLSPSRSVTLLAGYVPKFRQDFGSIGVLSEPAYTAELRFGFANRMLRLRGLQSDDYWIADMGITIR